MGLVTCQLIASAQISFQTNAEVGKSLLVSYRTNVERFSKTAHVSRGKNGQNGRGGLSAPLRWLPKRFRRRQDVSFRAQSRQEHVDSLLQLDLSASVV